VDQNTAIDYINEVRDRVDMPLLSYGLSKEEVFDAIVHVRLVELAGEHVRFADLKRWGMAAEVLSQFGFRSGVHDLLPISDAEINSNSALSQEDQNPGYSLIFEVSLSLEFIHAILPWVDSFSCL